MKNLRRLNHQVDVTLAFATMTFLTGFIYIIQGTVASKRTQLYCLGLTDVVTV